MLSTTIPPCVVLVLYFKCRSACADHHALVVLTMEVYETTILHFQTNVIRNIYSSNVSWQQLTLIAVQTNGEIPSNSTSLK